MTYGYQASTNRLTAITGANARSFSYDAYGNVLSNGVHSFQYNLAGNLTRTSDLNIDYRYDGHKRRVQEIDNSASQTTYSMYSQSGQLMHKLKGGVATDYIYAGSLLVAEKSGSTVDYMYTDLLGSPIAGNNGSAYKEHYRPWGEKKDHPLQLSDDVGYTGHQSDIETGLTYMQARYYDPVVGRFYAVDPVGFVTENSMSFNRYLYVNNNPYKYNDPDGRWLNLATAAVGAGVGALVESVKQGVSAYKGNGFDGKAVLRSTVMGGLIGFTGGLGAIAAQAMNLGRVGTAVATGYGAMHGAASGAAVDIAIYGEMKGGYEAEILGSALGGAAGQAADDLAGPLIQETVENALGKGGAAIATVGGNIAREMASGGADTVTGSVVQDVVLDEAETHKR
jgi:RHS repeat-associated protein